MNTRTRSTAFPPQALPDTTPAAARAVFALLKNLPHGSLDVQLPDGSHRHFGAAGASPRAALRLRSWDVCTAALRSGDIGFAESYIAGDWTSPDLVALMSLLATNREAIDDMVYGSGWLTWLNRLRHLFRRNSRAGSRRNIHAHYDLGNAFYRLWLDPTMNYSSAWFDGDLDRPMADAQWAKVRRALAECGAGPGRRVLEVGCGWGALAECAAREFGAEVTGVTLSTEQLAFGVERLASQNLRGQLRFQDYRDIDDGPFDAVVSIEMFEAVGREYWDGYFAMLHRQLKPGGRACIQSIAIRDDLFDRYVKSTDFIQQYIFPGGLLPSPSAFRAAAAKAGLSVVNELSFGLDYAETLRRWRQDFLAREAEVRALGFDTPFMRTWEFYLAYCEAAFATGNTGVWQFTLQRE